MNEVSLLVFARCAGFVFRAPGLSHPSVPPHVRAALALALTALIAPGLAHARSHLAFALIVALASELGTGAAIGMGASILYDAAYAGGRVLDDYVGIRGSVPGANFFAASAFGRVASLAVTAGFFFLGADRIVLAAIVRSFYVLAPGTMPKASDLLAYAVALPRAVMEAAALTAAPSVASVFAAQIALAMLARVIPRFASFTLSFPIMFAVALSVTALGIPALFRTAALPWLRVPYAWVH